MTQVEAGKLQMIPKITKPIELIEYAIKANQVQADKFNIQIEVEYPEEKMPKLFVDSEKIAWVLTNLLSNAIIVWNFMYRILVKVLIRAITRASSTVTSVYPVRKCREADWDYPYPKIL